MKRTLCALVLVAFAACDTSRCLSVAVTAPECVEICGPGYTWTDDPNAGTRCGWCHCGGIE